MKKRILSVLALCLLTGCLVFTITGCDLFKEKYTDAEVSTLEELINSAGYNTNIKLINDIDCEYETIEAIFCSKFDGQGHTIKNAIVNQSASFLCSSAIKNVNLENITIKAKNAISVGLVYAGDMGTIENVHVKNSTVSAIGCSELVSGDGWIDAFCVGGIYGGYGSNDRNGRVEQFYNCTIINCSVEDTTIEVSDVKKKMYVGGIAGGGNNISNCSITNCKITATATSIYNYPCVGGIVGYSEGSIENSFAKGCTLVANANYYSKGAFSLYSTSCAYLGGIAAYIKGNGNIKYCYGDSNNFYANSSGTIYAGGLIGYADKTSVNQCYTKSTYISMDKYAGGNANSVSRRAGGLIGSSNNNSVISCFAYNDSVLAEQCSGFKNSTDSKVAGLIAGFNTIYVMNCATYNGNLNSVTKDEFIPDELDGLNKCYVSNTKFGNINNLEVLNDDFWNAPNTIKSSLNLLGIYWQLTTNNLPYLDFSEFN